MRRKSPALLLAFLLLVELLLPGRLFSARAEAAYKGGAVSLSAGKYHMLLLTDNGEVWVWGDNRYGQLGTGDNISRSEPVYLMSGVQAVAAGGWTSYALTRDGKLYAWGSGEQGQLGVDTGGIAKLSPVEVMEGVASVSAALNRAYAVDTDGRLWAWGNSSYRYPDGERLSAQPRVIAEDVDRVFAGGSTTLLLREDTLTGWGGALASSIGTNKELTEVSVAAGVTEAASTSKQILYLAGGGLYTWQSSGSRQLKTGISAIWAGDTHFAALSSAGELFTWGENGSGQLGTGDQQSRSAPARVLGGVTCAAAGTGFTCAVKASGGIWGWGDNTYGQIAGGSNTYSYDFPHLAVPGAYDLPQASSGQYHILINGTLAHPDVAPVNKNGRLLAPLRVVFEKFGTVDWDGATKTVSATVGGTRISLRIGSSTAEINGVQVALDTPAMIFSGRTMVPLRFISEALGAEVSYEPSERTADIVLTKQSLALSSALREEYRRANLRVDVVLEDGSTGVASGVALHQNGLFVTNRHVVEHASSITVTSSAGVKSSSCEVFYVDEQLDYAILKTNILLPGAARLGQPSALRLGDTVALCGNSSGTTGVVRSTTITQFGYAYGGSFICGAESIQGNSGGGVYAASGLVGIIWGSAGGKTVAVPISSLSAEIERARSHYGLK